MNIANVLTIKQNQMEQLNEDKPDNPNPVNKRLFCKLCNYGTDVTSNWLAHVESQKHKRNGEKKPTKCDVCGYESTTHWNIQIHKFAMHSTKEERVIPPSKISSTINTDLPFKSLLGFAFQIVFNWLVTASAPK